MEFSFDVSTVLNIDEEGFVILDSAKLTPSSKSSASSTYFYPYSKAKMEPEKEALKEILDRIGEASSKAQGLKQTITSYIKFLTNTDHRIYMKADSKKVYGFIKMGKKNLFHRDNYGNVKEIKPLCVLDFYVHESVQRHGIGRAIFEKMLECENADPKRLAYDRPSIKLISFLKKHYNLVSYVPQNNNFVVFNAYWDAQSNTKAKTSKAKDHQSENEEKKESNPSKTSPLKYNVKREDIKELLNQNSQASMTNSKDNKVPSSAYALSNGTDQLNRQPLDIVKAGNKEKVITNGGKEDFGLTSIENQIKSTSKRIADCQDKIRQLNEEKQRLANPQERRFRDYHSNAPWADHSNQLNSYKSSNAYGSHYQQLQPMARNNK